MRSGSFVLILASVLLFLTPVAAVAGIEVPVEVVAGDLLTVKGEIPPGDDLYLVICSESFFSPDIASGSKERHGLEKKFAVTAIPSIYYVISNRPRGLAHATTIVRGQTTGLFAFPPFRYSVRANLLGKWDKIPVAVRNMLGPVKNQEQWAFLRYSHQSRFGINTITKERGPGDGTARMVLSDYKQTPEPWNRGVNLKLDRKNGRFIVSMRPYKNLAPGSRLAVYVNGERAGTISVKGSGYYFARAGTYMNPLLVVAGAFIIGILFVVMGAAGGLFTAAFQITVLGTVGPVGVNAANVVKPTNLFLTLCSPVTGLAGYFRDRRVAWPPALFFAVGIAIGAFWFGPEYSAKYLPMKAYKFYLGLVCLAIGVKLFRESMAGPMAKKKAVKKIAAKFNRAVKDAREQGRAVELGRVEYDRFNPVSFPMRFWGESFVARPLLMLAAGVIMGMISASFGVGGGFMFMPFMTSVLGYPMYLAVPIALAGTFATSVGGITRYIMLGYQPDWMMAVCIAIGAIGGGMVGPKVQKRLPEILLKRFLAGALIVIFFKYTGVLPFLR